MTPRRQFCRVVTLLTALLILTGCTHLQPTAAARDSTVDLIAASLGGLPGETEQLTVVFPVRPDSTQGVVYLFDRRADGWSLQAGPLPSVVGRNGFARPGEKREGDGRTPAGLFPLEFAFGYATSIATKMPYRQATDDDLWVDDVNSKDYNQWVKRGQTNASSFEEMKLGDHRYRYGLATGYNRHPVVAGLGSAIFIHVWKEEGISTSGCVALAETDLVAILEWLDPGKNPMVLMGRQRDLALLPGLSGLASVPDSCNQGLP